MTPGTPIPAAATGSTEEPVRIFSVGQTLPSGRVADREFIAAVVRNWERFQAKGDPRFPKPPAYVVPAASCSIGHETNSSIAKAYAERTDLPAVGWPDAVHMDGDFLMAHLRRIPAKLAAWIKAGAYGERSAEFYEDYEGFGPCLRRVSILGADIPACKDLGEMPTIVFDPVGEDDPNPLAFSESLAAMSRQHRRFGVRMGPQAVVMFSEQKSEDRTPQGTPMTPVQQKILDVLTALGIDVTKLDAAALDQIAAACVQAAPPNPTDDEKDAAKFSERLTKAVAAVLAPLRQEIDSLKSANANTSARFDAANRERDRAEIAAFCEKHRDQIFPYELDAAKGPTLIDQLLSLPTAVVATFAEGKKSPRQAFMDTIAARPPVARFAERLPQPLPLNDNRAMADRILGATDLGRAAKKLQAAG